MLAIVPQSEQSENAHETLELRDGNIRTTPLYDVISIANTGEERTLARGLANRSMCDEIAEAVSMTLAGTPRKYPKRHGEVRPSGVAVEITLKMEFRYE